MEIEGCEDHSVRELRGVRVAVWELQCVGVEVWAGFGAGGCGLGGLQYGRVGL